MGYTTINDPSAYFQTLLYTGNGGASRALTNTGNSDLQPDWLWIKKRNADRSHTLTDSSRGLTKYNEADDAGAEGTFTNKVLSVQSDGFTVGDNSSVNANNDTYVAWQWKANGGTTSSNTDGSITSTVQANTTAGFSIVTYTGNGTAGATFGHGLGVVPSWILVKGRDDVRNWAVYHHKNTDAPETEILNLNNTNATVDNANRWNDTAPTSTLITIKQSGEVNVSGEKYIAYCFAEKEGYSKFGIYKGNGNADGSFIYLGFKPSWVMIKRTDSTSSWHMWDNKREDYDGNPNDSALRADADGAENDTTDYSIDFLSNGFKLRNASDLDNASSGKFIYMAFAEQPLVSSSGVPATAR